MTNALPGGPQDFISSHIKEAVKAHYEYDGSNRLEYAYTAYPNAAHGEKCLATQYQYDGASDRVSGSKEYLSTWDSSWDF